MSLKLPMFADVRRTLSAWGTELRGGVLNIGRPRPPALPYLADGETEWGAVDPAVVGEGWKDFTATRVSPAAASFTTYTLSYYRYQVFAQILYIQLSIQFSCPAPGLVQIQLTLPAAPSPVYTLGSAAGTLMSAGMLIGPTSAQPVYAFNNYTLRPYVLDLNWMTAVVAATTYTMVCTFFCETTDG